MASKAQVKTHESIKSTGKKQKDKIRILLRVDQTPSTIEDLATWLNLKENTVSGRLSDLQKEGLVKIIGERSNSGGKSMSLFVITPKEEIKYQSITYRNRRKLAIMKNLKNNYSDLLTQTQIDALGLN